jgi:hypothetical protein
MDYPTLINELTSDPLGIGYGDMTDAEVAASLNAADRERIVPTLTSTQVFEAIDPGEFASLTDAQKALVRDLFAIGTVDITPDSNGRAVILNLFDAGSTTRANLLAEATEPISRAMELKLPTIKTGYVAKARAQGGLT